MMDENDLLSDSQNGRNSSPRRRSRSPLRRSRSRSRSPRNWRRGERDNRRSREKEARPRIRDAPGGKVRLYVCNMPYDVKWQVLKDVFKKEVGSAVSFVELYENPDGKSSGAGVVEIRGIEQAEAAIDKMDRYEINGRKIIVREEREKDRMRHMGSGGRDHGGDRGVMGLMRSGVGGGMGSSGNRNMGAVDNVTANTHGISPQLLQQLGIDPVNITNQIFVANLDYKVNERKIREIFRMAGTVIDVDMKLDQDQKFRGMCIIRFEHPVEAVQAISMFNSQVLYERAMSVKIDKMSGDNERYSKQQIPNKLPNGLKSIGMGLGSGGTPINIQQLQSNLLTNSGNNMNTGMGMNNMNMAGNLGSAMGGGMGNLGSALGNIGNMGTLATGLGNLGNNMGSLGNNMGGMGSVGNMNTSFGSSMNSSLGMNNMGMNSLSNTALGNNVSSGMGNDMLNTGMNMRNNMASPTGVGSVGGGMDMSGGLGMTSSMSMGNSLTGSGMGGMGMGGGMSTGNSNLMGSGMMGGSRGGGNEESTTVFVRNLPFNFTWTDLKGKFQKCGDVRFAEVKMENGKSKGYGTVRFTSNEDARRAVNVMNGMRVDGRQLEVRLNRS